MTQTPPASVGPQSASGGSVFWRIPITRPQGERDRRAVELIEIDAEGYVVRGAVAAADGTPLEVTRPDDYGAWNDSQYVPRTPPGSPEFAKFWIPLGHPVSREEFERAYARADAELPPQGDLGSRALAVGCVLVLVLVTAALALTLGWVH